MFFISLVKTEFLIKFITSLFIISFLFLALVPIVGVSKRRKRWLDLYFRLQPIEILKLYLF